MHGIKTFNLEKEPLCKGMTPQQRSLVCVCLSKQDGCRWPAAANALVRASPCSKYSPANVHQPSSSKLSIVPPRPAQNLSAKPASVSCAKPSAAARSPLMPLQNSTLVPGWAKVSSKMLLLSDESTTHEMLLYTLQLSNSAVLGEYCPCLPITASLRKPIVHASLGMQCCG